MGTAPKRLIGNEGHFAHDRFGDGHYVVFHTLEVRCRCPVTLRKRLCAQITLWIHDLAVFGLKVSTCLLLRSAIFLLSAI
jgi:hypothetical protein